MLLGLDRWFQWARALPALLGDGSSVPSTHVRGLPATRNPRSKESLIPLGPSWRPTYIWLAPTHTHTCLSLSHARACVRARTHRERTVCKCHSVRRGQIVLKWKTTLYIHQRDVWLSTHNRHQWEHCQKQREESPTQAGDLQSKKYMFRQIWYRNLFLASYIIHECKTKIKTSLVFTMESNIVLVTFVITKRRAGSNLKKEEFSLLEKRGLVTLQQVRRRDTNAAAHFASPHSPSGAVRLSLQIFPETSWQSRQPNTNMATLPNIYYLFGVCVCQKFS